MRFHLGIAMALWLGASPGSAASAEIAKNTAIAPMGPIQVTYLLHFAPEPRGDVVKQG